MKNTNLNEKLSTAFDHQLEIERMLNFTKFQHQNLQSSQTATIAAVNATNKIITTMRCKSRQREIRAKYIRQNFARKNRAQTCVEQFNWPKLQNVSDGCHQVYENIAGKINSMQFQVHKLKSYHVMNLNKINDRKFVTLPPGRYEYFYKPEIVESKINNFPSKIKI